MAVMTKTKWKVDTIHSVVQFKVKHLAISTVMGTFKLFHGELFSQDEDFDNAEVHFVIDSTSMDTNHAQRDSDLKSPEFFYTEKFPNITFDGILQKTNDNYKLEGELTIRDVSKTVAMDVELTGTGKGRFGDTRAGFEVDGKINRKDFGLTWSLLTEAGGLVVGEEVKLHFDIQLIKEA
jgi:polyisoprenoid-binding protein YceI